MAAKRLNRKFRSHPTSEDIAAFINYTLSAKERDRILQHLSKCNFCRKQVASVARSLDVVRKDNEQLA